MKSNKPLYYFKKSFFGGMILMIKDRNPGNSPGFWIEYWRKATEPETQIFMTNYEKLKFYKELIDSVKENNPEVLI